MTMKTKPVEKTKMNRTLEDYLNLPYRLIITPDDEGGYGVAIDELPGCVTYALSWEDIPAMAREAMASWIGSALQHDEPVPEPGAVAVP